MILCAFRRQGSKARFQRREAFPRAAFRNGNSLSLHYGGSCAGRPPLAEDACAFLAVWRPLSSSPLGRLLAWRALRDEHVNRAGMDLVRGMERRWDPGGSLNVSQAAKERERAR